MPNFHATGPQLEQVRLWITRDHLSTAQIAAYLGVNRSQAAGIIHRLGLTGHRPARGHGGGALKAQPIPTSAANNLANKIEARSTDPGLPPAPKFQPLTVEAKPLLKLRPGECKWPTVEDRAVVGGHWFCAEATRLGERYCPHHMTRASANAVRRVA